VVSMGHKRVKGRKSTCSWTPWEWGSRPVDAANVSDRRVGARLLAGYDPASRASGRDGRCRHDNRRVRPVATALSADSFIDTSPRRGKLEAAQSVQARRLRSFPVATASSNRRPKSFFRYRDIRWSSP